MGFMGPRHMFTQEVGKPKQAGATLGRLAMQFRPYWGLLLIIAVLLIGNTYVQVLQPRLLGQAVDCFLTPASAQRLGLSVPGSTGASANCWYQQISPDATSADYVAGLGSLVLFIVGIQVAATVMGGAQFFLMTWAGQHVLRNLRVQVFKHLHSLSMNYYSKNEAGNIMSRITNDMDTIQQALSFTLVSVLSGALQIVWTAWQMFAISPGYALVSLSVVPLMLVATLWFSAQARRAFRKTRVEIGKVNADLQESISGVREVQAFGREDANIANFRVSNAANRDANIKAVAFTSALSPTLEALGYLAVAIVTVVGGIVLLRGMNMLGTVMSLGLVITFISYVQRFNMPVHRISVMWASLQSALAGAERIFGILDTVPDVQDKPQAAVMPSIQGRVEFVDVDAAYKPDELVLKNVSFVAEPGQMVAIVGPTGAGKTTIINLIPRFYDVVGGSVRIDGTDVKDVTRASLRSQIGIVLQDTFLFSDTVMNNIRFGRPEATDEEVKEAARLAHVDDFVQRMPQGYETVLGERGAGLSQGQRQLVAIARAALVNPRVLILDEATSSVDTRTERQIQQALITLLEGRTSFVIAHRLSTIRHADQVLVVDDGHIVESGRHEELLARKGAYHALYMRQFVTQADGGTNGDGHRLEVAPAV